MADPCCAECRYAECRVLFLMLNAIMISVILLIVVRRKTSLKSVVNTSIGADN